MYVKEKSKNEFEELESIVYLVAPSGFSSQMVKVKTRFFLSCARNYLTFFSDELKFSELENIEDELLKLKRYRKIKSSSLFSMKNPAVHISSGLTFTIIELQKKVDRTQIAELTVGDLIFYIDDIESNLGRRSV